jgi:Holliday junction resolvasome RuvABC DNA-binding subunit
MADLSCDLPEKRENWDRLKTIGYNSQQMKRAIKNARKVSTKQYPN